VTLGKVVARVNNVTFEPVADGFGGRQQPVEEPLSGWLERVPEFEAGSAVLTGVLLGLGTSTNSPPRSAGSGTGVPRSTRPLSAS
jgi:hypothetical protein